MHRKPTDEELSNVFAHHAPFGDQAERYGKVRAAALEFAKVIRDLTPCSPQQTRAINSVQEAMMLANSSIALNEKPVDQPEVL